MSKSTNSTKETIEQVALRLANSSLSNAIRLVALIGSVGTSIGLGIMIATLDREGLISLPGPALLATVFVVSILTILLGLYGVRAIKARVKQVLLIQNDNLLNSK